MPSALHAARHLFGRARPNALLRARANARSYCVKPMSPVSTRGPKHEQDRTALCTATYSTCTNIANSSTGSGRVIGASSNMSHKTRASPEQHRSLPCGGMRRLRAESCRAAWSVGPTRMFGGQSVVPWELALFLVEEMKAEMIQPGAVVYTAALAECRWAGEQEHVDYLLQEMEAEGLSIVPGIPGAADDDLPPSQAPPLFGKLPETPPSTGSTSEHLSSSGSTAIAGSPGQDFPVACAADAFSAMQSAARAADTALATVETMWARGEEDPSPATCRAALDACAAGGQWERALSLVRDAASGVTAEAGADRDDGGGEEEESVSGRVQVLALEGKWNEALLLVQRQTGL